MLFLVQGRITHSRYMGDRTEEAATRIVIAENAEQAAAKFERAISEQTVEFQDYYYGRADEVHPAIE